MNLSGKTENTEKKRRSRRKPPWRFAKLRYKRRDAEKRMTAPSKKKKVRSGGASVGKEKSEWGLQRRIEEGENLEI